MKIKNSEQREVLRSSIRLHPLNPKHHTDKEIQRQVKNFKQVGYLGGIVYNEVTKTLIDGHRRVYALDIIHKYDGSPETDYTLRVEVCQLDRKQEKEQLVFMAMANGRADLKEVAKFIEDIDPDLAGLDEFITNEIKRFNILTPETVADDIDLLDVDHFEKIRSERASRTKGYETEEDRQKWHDIKNTCRDNVSDKIARSLVVNFADTDERAALFEAIGELDNGQSVIPASKIMSIIYQ